ncbi:heterokaryon incompatibility protein-domain-containing protein [Xylaria sp. FL1777]|nr:heterokaryon incompatibility protein-domain-containing protein [Xylaria sp. FL1777]
MGTSMSYSTEIRILHLLPSAAGVDAEIECGLQAVSLAEAADYGYEALSYTWGDQSSLVDIKVSGKNVSVTRNLYAALRAIRLRDRQRRLWIDQLCINQWDLEEKAAQVRQMRHIYTSCSRCLIWLGDIPPEVPLDDAEGTVQLIGYLAAYFLSEDAASVAKPPCLASQLAFQGSMTAMACISPPQNPWWNRIWTVQEATLPQDAVFLWGPLSVTWNTMQHASRGWCLKSPRSVVDMMTDSASAWYTMLELMNHLAWLSGSKMRIDDPLTCIFKWRFRAATDPRDKIYGLLGLFPPASLPTVECCSYELTVQQVYIMLTMDLIRQNKSLWPLAIGARLAREDATPGLPSWVLDISGVSKYRTDWFHLFDHEWYDAAGGRQLDPDELRIETAADETCIILKGTRVAAIARTGNPFPVDRNKDIENSLVPRLRTTLRAWATLAGERQVGKDADGEEEFAATMLGNLIRNDQQRPERRATAQDLESVINFMRTGTIDSVWGATYYMAFNKTFFVTESGMLGLGHLETEAGNEVWVLDGGRVPFVLRSRGSSRAGDYELVGRCSVEGIMFGELFEVPRPLHTIRLY